MRRKLFAFASVLSLLLCVATAVLWVVSTRWEMVCMHTAFSPDGAKWHWINWAAWADNGFFMWESTSVGVNTENFDSTWDTKPGDWRWRVQPLGTSGRPVPFLQSLRPVWHVQTAPPTRPDVLSYQTTVIRVPYWILILVLLPLPVLWVVSRARLARRDARGRCAACAYNLAGNTSGVCPECGTPIPSCTAIPKPKAPGLRE